jgi:hypothetical protein
MQKWSKRPLAANGIEFGNLSAATLAEAYDAEIIDEPILLLTDLMSLNRLHAVFELDEKLAFFCARAPDWPMYFFWKCLPPSTLDPLTKHHPLFPLISHANPDMLSRVARLMLRKH